MGISHTHPTLPHLIIYLFIYLLGDDENRYK